MNIDRGFDWNDFLPCRLVGSGSGISSRSYAVVQRTSSAAASSTICVRSCFSPRSERTSPQTSCMSPSARPLTARVMQHFVRLWSSLAPALSSAWGSTHAVEHERHYRSMELGTSAWWTSCIRVLQILRQTRHGVRSCWSSWTIWDWWRTCSRATRLPEQIGILVMCVKRM